MQSTSSDLKPTKVPQPLQPDSILKKSFTRDTPTPLAQHNSSTDGFLSFQTPTKKKLAYANAGTASNNRNSIKITGNRSINAENKKELSQSFSSGIGKGATVTSTPQILSNTSKNISNYSSAVEKP